MEDPLLWGPVKMGSSRRVLKGNFLRSDLISYFVVYPASFPLAIKLKFRDRFADLTGDFGGFLGVPKWEK
jgi:hypothetical protein